MTQRINDQKEWLTIISLQAGFGGFPWTANTSFPGRKDPMELATSVEGIVESDGTVPQCEVTVQLSAPYNTTGGLVATVLNLIFTNWCAICVFGLAAGAVVMFHQLSRPFNTTGGEEAATVLNLIFTDWCSSYDRANHCDFLSVHSSSKEATIQSE